MVRNRESRFPPSAAPSLFPSPTARISSAGDAGPGCPTAIRRTGQSSVGVTASESSRNLVFHLFGIRPPWRLATSTCIGVGPERTRLLHCNHRAPSAHPCWKIGFAGGTHSPRRIWRIRCSLAPMTTSSPTTRVGKEISGLYPLSSRMRWLRSSPASRST